jgi:hypothetical protein
MISTGRGEMYEALERGIRRFCMDNFDFRSPVVSEGLGEEVPFDWDNGVFD